MIDNKDFDYIKDKFDSDGLKAPESLSEDAISKMLDAAGLSTDAQAAGAEEQTILKAGAEEQTDDRVTIDVKPAAKPKKRWTRPLIAVAACAALALGLIPFMNNFNPGGEETLTASADSLDYFNSYDELGQKIESIIEEQQPAITYGVQKDIVLEDASGTLADSDSAAPQSNALSGGSSVSGGAATGAEAPAAGASGSDNSAVGASGSDNPDHSSTYTQVDGVDEADIVKTDGKYIYYLSDMENQVLIAKAKDGKAKRVASINAGQIGDYIQDLYVKGDHLIIVGGFYDDMDSNDNYRAFARPYTTVTTFDIADRTAPEKIDQYSQTGHLVSSRMIDDRVILVTNDYIYSYTKGKAAPYVCYGSDKPVKLGIENICGIPDCSTPAFTVVSSIDTATGKVSKEKVTTKAILGGSQEIYCSGDTLYITASIMNLPRLVRNGEFEKSYDGAFVPGESDTLDWTTDQEGYVPEDYPPKTCVLKVSLADGKVNYEKTATVEGTLNNQFSMDDAGGVFKIATTSTRKGQDVNNLFLFDENMKELGSVRNFARDEHIEAVRYVKDKAYVITYEQTDPLFIIDLADPKNPKIEGHVKISGFSTLLVPAGENHLLGLGFSTESTEWGEATDGVKLALFDISDPSNPKVADSKAFAGMDSEVQYNHKALLVGPKASYYAIPYYQWVDSDDDDAEWSDEDGSEIYGILKFSVKNGKLTGFKKMHASENVTRCIYIGDYIYGICSDDSIEGFHIN